MSLSTMLRLLSYSLVGLAALPVLLSGEIPLTIWALFGVGLVAGWLTGGREWPRVATRILTGILVAGFLLLSAISVQTGQWLVNAIIFALFATVARGLQLQTARQFFQFVGLSFLVLIAASVTNPDLYFALFFLLYVVLLTWALTYTHLMEKVEMAQGRRGLERKASQLVSGRFLLGSSLLALALLFSSLLIFFLFPRLGLGFFSSQTRKGEEVTGFSDEISLGHFGTLQNSSRVVLRLEVVKGQEIFPDAGSLHLRGMAFDRYEGGAWVRSTRRQYALPPVDDGYREIFQDTFPIRVKHRLVEVDIYQEPLELENQVLFTLDRGLRLRPFASRFDVYRGSSRKYFQDLMGNIIHTGSGSSSVSYTVVAGLPQYDLQALRQASTLYPRYVSELFLQLPEGLDPRIGELARSVVGGAATTLDKAVALENYLKRNYGYTTQGDGPAADPVSHFLFERKKGHCEYFATAMVLMLRTQGIAARPVNGFLGAEYNEYGNYYLVTEGRAHSWVEVYLGEAGWVSFDPTPPSEGRFDVGGFLTALRQWWDSLKLQWYKWMVEYNFEKQISVYARLWNMMSPQGAEIELSPDMTVQEFRRQLRKVGKTLFSSGALSLLFSILVLPLLASLLWRRWKRRTRETVSQARRHMRTLRALLARKGFRVMPGTTLPGLVRQGVARSFSAQDALDALVALLEEASYQPGATPSWSKIARLERAVRKGKRLQSGR